MSAGRCYVEEDGVVDVVPLRAAIATSKLIGESQLVGGFAATRGFGLACHVDALDDAMKRVPWLRPFVDAALDVKRREQLAKPKAWERAFSFVFGDINALYVNVLVVPPGGAVERHVDSTLGVAEGGVGAGVLCPRAVAVCYVDVPGDLVGGALRLFEGEELRASITPQVGRFVLFRGDLAHEVTATSASSPRVSVVAELYALPRDRLARLPRVRMQSHGFADVLERLRSPQ